MPVRKTKPVGATRETQLEVERKLDSLARSVASRASLIRDELRAHRATVEQQLALRHGQGEDAAIAAEAVASILGPRLDGMDERLEAVEAHKSVTEARMTKLEKSVEVGNADTAQILRIVGAGKRGIRFIEWVIGVAASVIVVLTGLHFVK